MEQTLTLSRIEQAAQVLMPGYQTEYYVGKDLVDRHVCTTTMTITVTSGAVPPDQGEALKHSPIGSLLARSANQLLAERRYLLH